MGYENRKIKLRGYDLGKSAVTWLVEEPPRRHTIFWSGGSSWDHGNGQEVENFSIAMPWIYYCLHYTKVMDSGWCAGSGGHALISGIACSEERIENPTTKSRTFQPVLPNMYEYRPCFGGVRRNYLEEIRFKEDFRPKKITKTLKALSDVVISAYWGASFNWDGLVEEEKNYETIAKELGVVAQDEGDGCLEYPRDQVLEALQGWKIKDVLAVKYKKNATFFREYVPRSVLKNAQQVEDCIAW